MRPSVKVFFGNEHFSVHEHSWDQLGQVDVNSAQRIDRGDFDYTSRLLFRARV